MIPLKRLLLSATNRPIETILYWIKTESMLLDPPYQRGVVWGKKRQRNLIRSILMGIPIPAIIINDRTAARWDGNISCVVIDGKQRVTAIRNFLTDELEVPGEWFEMDKEFVLFSELPTNKQRGLRNTPIPFCEGQLKSLEDETEVFDLINFGGLLQGETDEDL